MAYTFDDIYSAQDVNYAFHHARIMLNAHELDPLPPPFNLVSLPFWLVRGALLLGTGGACDLPTPRSDGTDSSRNESRRLGNWERKATLEEESARVLAFVVHDENRMVESGNWRARMLSRLKLSVASNEEHLEKKASCLS